MRWALACLAWVNSWHFAMPLVSRKMMSEKQAQKFHTCYQFPDQIWVKCLWFVGNMLYPIRSTTHIWQVCVISVGFLRSFLSCDHFPGKPPVALQNTGCFLRLFIAWFVSCGNNACSREEKRFNLIFVSRCAVLYFLLMNEWKKWINWDCSFDYNSYRYLHKELLF